MTLKRVGGFAQNVLSCKKVLYTYHYIYKFTYAMNACLNDYSNIAVMPQCDYSTQV